MARSHQQRVARLIAASSEGENRQNIEMRRVKGKSEMLCIQSPHTQFMSIHLLRGTMGRVESKIGSNEDSTRREERRSKMQLSRNPIAWLAAAQSTPEPKGTCCFLSMFIVVRYTTPVGRRVRSGQTRPGQMGVCGPSNTRPVTPLSLGEGPSLLIRPQNQHSNNTPMIKIRLPAIVVQCSSESEDLVSRCCIKIPQRKLMTIHRM